MFKNGASALPAELFLAASCKYPSFLQYCWKEEREELTYAPYKGEKKEALEEQIQS